MNSAGLRPRAIKEAGMKVKLLVSRTGADGAQNAGDEIEVSTDEATRMLNANPPQATPVRAAKPETTARKPKAEKAAK